MTKNILYFVIALVVLVLVGGVILISMQQRTSQRSPEAEELFLPTQPVPEEESGLGSELNQNPGSKVPETNPFQQAKTNPFEGYRNPFE